MTGVQLGWQYALLHPDPGPPPRRPAPPERHQLDPTWLAAQHREESRLNVPLQAAAGGGAAVAVVFLALGLLGWIRPALSAFVVAGCVAGSVWCVRQIRLADRLLRERVARERVNVEKVRASQDSELFARQERHAAMVGAWQRRRAAYERQKHWYAVSLPGHIDRVDVAGGTLTGWSAMLTMVAAPRLRDGGEVTVIDLSEGAVAGDLLTLARGTGVEPLVWVLPGDLPRIDLGAALDKRELADLLSLVVSVSEEQGQTRDLSYDNAIIERIVDVLGDDATVSGVIAALRVLAQVGDPGDDVRRGLLGADQADRLTAMFGRAATERVVLERAWTLESRLRQLDGVGSAVASLPPSPLRVVSLDRGAGVLRNKVLGSYVVTALTHVLRRAGAAPRWRHTVFLLGAEKLRADVLDRLTDACEATGTGLVLAYRSLPAHVRERLGRGDAAVAFMRLGNAEDAKAASEQIGTQHRLVLSQLTTTVGTSVTDTTGDSYTSTVGDSDSVATSTSTGTTSGRSSGRGESRENNLLPFAPGNSSRSSDRNSSTSSSDSESITVGISTSTAWGISTSRAVGDSESLARTVQRSREFLVEQHELQQLPASAMIVTYASPSGRRVVAADANPAIVTLGDAIPLTVDEARRRPDDVVADFSPTARPGGRTATERTAADSAAGDGAAADEDARGDGVAAAPEQAERPPVTPVSWRGGGQPPPNLGPPPERLDWRKPRG